MITTAESALITACQAALGSTVRKVDSLPGTWSIDLLRQVLQTAPAVYVAFLGGGAARGGEVATINARFAAYDFVERRWSYYQDFCIAESIADLPAYSVVT